MKILKWFVFTILYLSALAYAVSAQTVGPLVAEGGKGKAHGEFTVTNNGVQPLVATVTAMTFKLASDGKAIYLPLEATSVVKITDTSAKVGARQSHSFGYEVQCMSDKPCLIAFLPRMVTGLHTTEGIQIGLVIPSVVYLCPDKGKGCRQRVRLAAGIPVGH
jgi:hypothetical protein